MQANNRPTSTMSSGGVVAAAGMLLLAFGLQSGGVAAAGSGSCAAAKKCCSGQDTDCAVTHDLNFISSDPCYCDHGCLDMGDCCADFKDYCGVLDCKVSSWSSWSSCSSSCGLGRSTRSRTVTHPAANGGAECPDLEQHRSCRTEGGCTDTRAKDKVSALRETAMLLPGKWSSKRATKTWDVRQNLRSFVKPEQKDEYCVVFKVDKAMKSCLLNKDTTQLHRGNEVCVSCESKAIREQLGDRCTGHGQMGKQTRFKNVITPACHGRWERISAGDECPCPDGPHFIFV